MGFETMGVAMGRVAKDEGSTEVDVACEGSDVGSCGTLEDDIYDVVRSAVVKEVKKRHAARQRNLRAMLERAEAGVLVSDKGFCRAVAEDERALQRSVEGPDSMETLNGP